MNLKILLNEFKINFTTNTLIQSETDKHLKKVNNLEQKKKKLKNV